MVTTSKSDVVAGPLETALLAHAQIRAWAKGLYRMEAATELLIRGFGGRFAAPGWEWVRPNDSGGHWIDFEHLPEHINVLSGGEQRYLRLAASLAFGDLFDQITGIGAEELDLVLAGWPMRRGPMTPAPWSSTDSPTVPTLSKYRDARCTRGHPGEPRHRADENRPGR